MHHRTAYIPRLLRLVAQWGLLALTALRPAFATITVAPIPANPPTVTVGETFASYLAIANLSTPPHDVGFVEVDSILVTPACGSGLTPTCIPPYLEAGRLSIGNPVARPGTACAGNHFSLQPANPVTGAVEIIAESDVILGPSRTGGSAATCIIDFTVSVLGLPGFDADPGEAGLQTETLARVLVALRTLPSPEWGGGFLGVAETTVMPPPCPDGSSLLGRARACTILQTGSARPGSVKLAVGGSAAGIGGDLCVGPGSKLAATGASFITGAVVLDQDPAGQATATCMSRASGISCEDAESRDLGREIGACAALAASAAAKPCTIGDYRQSLSALAGPARSITGMAGENVVCVKEVSLGKDQVITLSGTPTTTFVINVKDRFAIKGGKIKVDGTSVLPSGVVYNILGAGEPVAFTDSGSDPDCCRAEIDGSLVAGQRNIALNPGRINGVTCGDGSMSFDGGSSVCRALLR